MIQDRRQLIRGLSFLAGAAALSPAWRVRAQDTVAQNLFISPAGQPFRAADEAPYPVTAWFKQADKDQDGRLTHAEFVADSAAFFKVLDTDGDGVLTSDEVSVYEQTIAPEIIGKPYQAALNGPRRFGRDGGLIWQAQLLEDLPMKVDPDDTDPATMRREANGVRPDGAAAYSLFNEPEPIMAADFNVDGRITRANFMTLANQHFTTLDAHQKGFVTLADLPKTWIQKQLHK